MITYREDAEGTEVSKEQIKFELEVRREAMLERSEKKRLERCFHERRREALRAEALLQSHSVADEKLHEIRQTYLLAEELSRRKRKEVIKWQASNKPSPAYNPSNCELEKIRSKKLEDKIRQESRNIEQINEWYKDDDYLEKLKVDAAQRKLEYRRDLQNQMIDNRRRVREEAEERQRERKILEEVAEKVQEEDLQVEMRNREIAALMQAEEEAFRKARQMWKEKRMELLRKEHENIARMIAEKELQARTAAEKKSDTHAQREETSRRIAEKIMAEEARRRDREQVCIELFAAEKEEQEAEEAAKSKLKKNRVARELLTDMERHRKVAGERKVKDKATDAAFAKYFAEERNAEDEKEKQKEMARHETKMQYGRDMRGIMTENKIRHAVDILEVQTETIRESKDPSRFSGRETVIPVLTRS